MDPNANAVAIQKILAQSSPEYIRFLQSQGLIPADYAQSVAAPVAPVPVAAPVVAEPLAAPPPAPVLTPIQQAPMNPLQRELARYFGL